MILTAGGIDLSPYIYAYDVSTDERNDSDVNAMDGTLYRNGNSGARTISASLSAVPAGIMEAMEAALSDPFRMLTVSYLRPGGSSLITQLCYVVLFSPSMMFFTDDGGVWEAELSIKTKK